MITMIAAIADNNALGKENKLVWNLPDDFKRFKKLTSGHPIIMGRKTFESLPGILPNRKHIVITHKRDYHPQGCLIAHTIKEAIDLAANEQEIFIIGGGEIYKLAMPFADKLEITQVNATFDADAFFPKIVDAEWKLIAEEFHDTDERHAYSFSYNTYLRK